MDYDIKTIEREDLKAKLDRGDDFKLIMAMHEWGFRVAHIPGSLHYNTVEHAHGLGGCGPLAGGRGPGEFCAEPLAATLRAAAGGSTAAGSTGDAANA